MDKNNENNTKNSLRKRIDSENTKHTGHEEPGKWYKIESIEEIKDMLDDTKIQMEIIRQIDAMEMRRVRRLGIIEGVLLTLSVIMASVMSGIIKIV